MTQGTGQTLSRSLCTLTALQVSGRQALAEPRWGCQTGPRLLGDSASSMLEAPTWSWGPGRQTGVGCSEGRSLGRRASGDQVRPPGEQKCRRTQLEAREDDPGREGMWLPGRTNRPGHPPRGPEHLGGDRTEIVGLGPWFLAQGPEGLGMS